MMRTRLDCLATTREIRDRNKETIVAAWSIEQIEINGGFLPGLSLVLPKGLTCVIGPRGSGKSTLAEAIRYALANDRVPSKTTKDLIEKNIVNAVVSITTAPGGDGTAYLIRRTGRQAPSLCNLKGESIQRVDLERGTFLPLDAYSSNEVEDIADETVGEKRRSLLDDLRGADFAKIQLTIGDRQRALEANRDAVKQCQSTIASLKEQIEELADAPAKLAALPPSSGGDDSGILTSGAKQLQANESERNSLDELTAIAKEYREELKRIAGSLANDMAIPVIFEESKNQSVMNEVDTAAKSMIQKVNLPLTQADNELQAFAALLPDVRTRLSTCHAEQESAFARLEELNLAASQAVQQRTTAEQAVAQLRELERKHGDEQRRLQDLLEERKQLKGSYLLEREKISALRMEIAAGLQKEAGDKVRVRVLANADSISFQQQLAAGLQGARVRNHEDIVNTLMRIRPEDLAQLIQDNDIEGFEAQTALGKERARKVLEAFREKLDPMQLEIVPIDDRICIELNVASSAEPNFKDASELSRGQKCTALLPILLARRDTPLLIDQPEDNLDNRFVFETVVENIRRIKKSRQMIFITHNANIPVLGEADLVVVLDSDGHKGFIKKAGTVDECRDEIIDLLEGGREAFELRRRCYEKK